MIQKEISVQIVYAFFYLLVVRWSMQNRNGSDILVHPNTGFEVSDHGSWALT